MKILVINPLTLEGINQVANEKRKMVLSNALSVVEMV